MTERLDLSQGYYTRLEHAHEYAARGFRVFPVFGKVPAIAGWQEKATTDTNQIDFWFGHEFPDAGIAILTGPASGVLVLDVDTGKGKRGMDSLEELQAKFGPLPKTALVASGGGGLHHYFKHPEGVIIKNSASKLGADLDIRSNGGFIVAPPSIHESGNQYYWAEDIPLAVVPDWLIELLAKKPELPPMSDSSPRHESAFGPTDVYIKAAVDGELAALHSAVEGQRNDTLNRSAFSLGTLVGAGQLDRQVVEAALVDAALSIGLTEAEARSTIASGMEAGICDPRLTPEFIPPGAPVPVPVTSGFPEAAVNDCRDPHPDRRATIACDVADSYDVGAFRIDPSGVHWVDRFPNSEEPKPDIWICSRLDVVAYTRNANSEEWGKLIRFEDADGRPHEWPLPMALLAGEGTEFRERLLSQGLTISAHRRARQYLAEYVQMAQPTHRLRCVSTPGWSGANYVLPDRSYSQTDEHVIYQTNDRPDHAFRTAGTLTDWQQAIGAPCVGNSRLAFSVSVAFVPPLLRLVNEEGGGFHLRGGSSTGKTTILEVAASVWGGGDRPRYIQSWRTTTNGLEAIAEQHNDAFLPLDELGQIDPKEAGDAAYTLANGNAKGRANRSGGARRRGSWRLIFLSAGEISLRDHMLSGGQQTRAGQDVRMADIPVYAGQGLGGFETIHDAPSADRFARQLKEAASRFYGAPIRVFLEHLVQQDPTEVYEVVKAIQSEFTEQYVPAGASGEVSRVAGRFGLVAAAGEMATEAGILPWPVGEATRAATACFEAWLDSRSTSGAIDIEAGIAQVRSFIAAHGDGRFAPLKADALANTSTDSRVINNRAGYRRVADGEVEYLFFPGLFRKEACAGFDPKLIAQALAERNLLVKGPKGELTDSVRTPDSKRPRFYRIRAAILEGE